jgi:hypothetical protein
MSERRLVLELAVDGVWADDLDESARYWAWADEDGRPVTPEDRLNVVLEEWFREDVIVMLTPIPGEKCLDDDSRTVARTARIIGASTVPIPGGSDQDG